jgi:hypothetical protein
MSPRHIHVGFKVMLYILEGTAVVARSDPDEWEHIVPFERRT